MKDQLTKKLKELEISKFRASFHLKDKDLLYLKKEGYCKIKSHAKAFIETRLAPKEIKNDGKQTPMHGHPVFIAQHATATCCRSCLYKWHHIAKNKTLTTQEQNYIVEIIMAWLTKEVKQKGKNLHQK